MPTTTPAPVVFSSNPNVPANSPPPRGGPGPLKCCAETIGPITSPPFPWYDQRPCPGNSHEVNCPTPQQVVPGASQVQTILDWGTGLTKIFQHLLSPDWWKGIGMLILAAGIGVIGLFVWFRRDLGRVVQTAAAPEGEAAEAAA